MKANWRKIEPLLEGRGLAVGPAEREKLEQYAELLLHWNRRINLTGARDMETLFSRHLLDSLMLELLPRPSPDATCVDLGAGGGLPGIVQAIMHPGSHITGVEKVAKKITFLGHAAHTLGLDNYHPLRIDAREMAGLREWRGRTDIVMARAFAGLDELLRLAGPLLRPGGELWAMKGLRLDEEQAGIDPAALELFGPGAEVHPYSTAAGPGEEIGACVAVYRRNDYAAAGS
ncbi:MAG: 16S rRNA (guanine(527)-N(7))-methyltransferase RsmG [Deltaproteobacteria bacterium]|nr:16S rRNA (guanine(527)-N(7))-methyltransferase RsmG [Deltaproteobacteria bacterium]